MNSTYTVYGRKFSTRTFATDNEANAFMLANKGWGVIGVVGTVVHVAECSDEGVKV